MFFKLLFLLSVENENSMYINRYVFFWVVLLTCKLAFSFYVEVNPKHFMNTYLKSLKFGDLPSIPFHGCKSIYSENPGRRRAFALKGPE